ncbi:PilZ domain-containing protein [Bradyrhizobium genosp. P]|uniref:PilZ domain-containing protein n=1 Tax=Bradyrhizobium genosp. P TaxID=83641 RepID=UPI003CEDEE2D
MFANRRKSERRVCRSVAKIQMGTGSLPRDCMITDISSGGVKVIAEYLEIPEEFTIILSSGSQPRQCRLAWRIGHEFGAQFVD